jgi:hypothetical protein
MAPSAGTMVRMVITILPATGCRGPAQCHRSAGRMGVSALSTCRWRSKKFARGPANAGSGACVPFCTRGLRLEEYPRKRARMCGASAHRSVLPVSSAWSAT